MNANELADKLQMDKARALLYADTVVEAAIMLRQQQAEIEILKKQLEINIESVPPASWWKGDPTCGGITENYGLGKVKGDV